MFDWEREKVCTRKVAFLDEAEAAKVARDMRAKYGVNGIGLNHYKCQYCPGYHVGHCTGTVAIKKLIRKPNLRPPVVPDRELDNIVRELASNVRLQKGLLTDPVREAQVFRKVSELRTKIRRKGYTVAEVAKFYCAELE